MKTFIYTLLTIGYTAIFASGFIEILNLKEPVNNILCYEGCYLIAGAIAFAGLRAIVIDCSNGD